MNIVEERLSLTDLAKHFWCVQAADYIRDKDVDITALDGYVDVIAEAESWIDSTLDKGLISPNQARRPEHTILVYPTARMFISVLGNEYVLRRFATSVSKYAGIMLDAEDDRKIVLLAATPGNFGEEPWQLLYQKAEPNRKVTIGERVFEWKLYFTDYINVAQNFHDAYWKLVNRPLSDGWVYLLKADVTRLMEEAIKTRISRSGLKSARDIPSIKDLPANLRKAAERLSKKAKERISEFQSYEIGQAGAGESAYPGCIKQILDKLSRGIGVSHNERLALVFFLSNLGKDAEEILQAFSKSPDFDAERSRYYVEHAMGLRGGGTKYKPFGCPKLKTFGLCNPLDEWCKNGKIGGRPLRGPLGLYRAKSWVIARRKEKAKNQPNQG
jgi:DNA primase large subunit